MKTRVSSVFFYSIFFVLLGKVQSTLPDPPIMLERTVDPDTLRAEVEAKDMHVVFLTFRKKNMLGKDLPYMVRKLQPFFRDKKLEIKEWVATGQQR